MTPSYGFTRHANERSTSRNISPMIAEIILEFGESKDAGDGARKYALTKLSMGKIRRHGGRGLAKAIDPYRNRNAYVVAKQGHIITVAYSRAPLFN